MLSNHSCIASRIAAVWFLAIGLFTAPAAAQVAPREREPASDSLDRAPAREGGIPRSAVEAQRDREGGLEEGLPDVDSRQFKEIAPRWIAPRGDWRLGVWAYNTETGVVVTRVAPGSAAERRGLEPGDRIVGVGGYQVGYVGDLLYPLGYELQRQAGGQGEVLLLVQNVRGNELMNLEVQLDRGGRVRPLPRERE
jgi:hypothetical protein